MVPGRGRKRKKESGMLAMRRIEDLIEMMGSQKRKRNECVENGCSQKRPRECVELLQLLVSLFVVQECLFGGSAIVFCEFFFLTFNLVWNLCCVQ